MNIGGCALDCNIWFQVDTYKSATVDLGFVNVTVIHFATKYYFAQYEGIAKMPATEIGHV